MESTSHPPRRAPRVWTGLLASVTPLLLGLLLAPPAAQAADGDRAEQIKHQQAACALLDDLKAKGMMDGLLYQLLVKCGREHELGQVRSEGAEEAEGNRGAGDVAVSDPSGDSSAGSHTQSETSIARNPVTGTLCSAYNDSFHGIQENLGFSGFSRSTDGGLTWDDRGAVDSDDSGDPSLIWRKVDEKFYYVALRNGGLGIFRSDDDCQSFAFLSQISSTGNDDKEIAAVDNNPTSPHYGNIYVAWTDFTDGRINVRRSTTAGASWSAPIDVSVSGADVQGAWPAVAPNGDVYVSWVRWNPSFPVGPIDIEVVRSTDGGASFSPVTNPATAKTNPRDSAATGNCGRPALKGNMRYLPSPTIAVGADGVVHIIYSYDPDAFNSGDVINVYYRRSTDNGATWDTEVQVNDVSTNDQYQPSLSVSDAGVVTVGWYDRRNDVNNTLIEYYGRRSFDGGVTWSEPSTLLSDVASPIFLDPNLANCYHGDYDTQITSAEFAHFTWSDDRNVQGGHNDPDVFGNRIAVGTDFLVLASPTEVSVCAPTSADYTINVPQFQGFAEQVTLSATGNPAGSTVGFGTNPVTPPGSSLMSVTTNGATPGTATITVTGTSSPSAIVHSTPVTLNLFDANPGTPTLSTPANGAINVPAAATFTWTAATQAATYTLEVATDAGFTNIVATVSGIAGTTTTLTSPLATNTVHHWRVRATNSCGDGPNAAVFSFTTIPAPGDCPIGVTPTENLFEGFESGAAGWTHSGTGDSWAASTVRKHTGTFSFHANDPAVVSDQRLHSPAIALPSAGAAPLSLIFWQHQTIEDVSATACFDAAVIEISTDGGTNFTRLESEILVDPYDGPVDDGFQNPLANENAWCGDPQDWTKSITDLSAFAGQTVILRFRLASDNSVSREGWYIDDLAVQSCTVSVFADGFETGDTSAWTLVFP